MVHKVISNSIFRPAILVQRNAVKLPVMYKCTLLKIWRGAAVLVVALTLLGCKRESASAPDSAAAAGNQHNPYVLQPPDVPVPTPNELNEDKIAELAGLKTGEPPKTLGKFSPGDRQLSPEQFGEVRQQLGLTDAKLLELLDAGYGVRVDQKGGKPVVELVPPK